MFISDRRLNVLREKVKNREKGFYNQEEESPPISFLVVLFILLSPVIKLIFVANNVTPALAYGSKAGIWFKSWWHSV